MVLHAPFGGRVNAPWGMALGRRMRERLGVEVQVQTTDDGLMLRLPDIGRRAAGRRRSARSAWRRRSGWCSRKSAQSSLFGARFRMNAARALLLPRGNPRRRMPLWLQRLKSLDLLQAVQEFPVVPDPRRDLSRRAAGRVRHGRRCATCWPASRRARSPFASVQTEIPSPFAASLQFGFVIDWMYGDDAPRAEQRAALLSLDRALLDELMGGAGRRRHDARRARRGARAPARHRARPAGARRRRAGGARRSRGRPDPRGAARSASPRKANGRGTIRSRRCSRAGAWSPSIFRPRRAPPFHLAATSSSTPSPATRRRTGSIRRPA